MFLQILNGDAEGAGLLRQPRRDRRVVKVELNLVIAVVDNYGFAERVLRGLQRGKLRLELLITGQRF